MLHYKKGNLLEVKEGIITHGVNCQGVMGSGVALAIKQKYPSAFYSYKNFVAEDRELEKGCLGMIQILQAIPCLLYTSDAADDGLVV
jgi:O-acetyl-ADP-ribose deacetylase (regulator of RNase III)